MTDDEIEAYVNAAWDAAPDCKVFLLLDDGEQISVHRATLEAVNEAIQDADKLTEPGPMSAAWVVVYTKTMKYDSGYCHRMCKGGKA
jgi:hypothetical protein